jgi:hypothetical protein
MKSRPQNRDQNETRRPTPNASTTGAGAEPDIVPANEETEGATGALETPVTPPEMTKDGKPEDNRKGQS